MLKLSSNVNECKPLSGGKKTSLQKAISKQVAKIEKMESELGMKMSLRKDNTTSAFVTFESEVARGKAERAYRGNGLLAWATRATKLRMRGRGLHSPTFRLNVRTLRRVHDFPPVY